VYTGRGVVGGIVTSGVRVRPVGFGGFAALVVMVLLACLLVGAARAGNAGLTVRAVIWPNLAVTLAPKVLVSEHVVFKVENRSTKPEQFAIDGAETALIAPGNVVDLAVTFRKRGFYSFTLPDYQENSTNGYKPVGGRVKVT